MRRTYREMFEGCKHFKGLREPGERSDGSPTASQKRPRMKKQLLSKKRLDKKVEVCYDSITNGENDTQHQDR